MKKLFVGIAVLLALGMMASVAVAGVGNQMPSGPHWQVNFLGKDKDMPIDPDESPDRRSVFVDATGKTTIYITQDGTDEFRIDDANGTDDGKVYINLADGYYEVYARALGKPGGTVTITGLAEVDNDQDGAPEVFLNLGSFELKRGRVKPDGQPIGGKPVTVNITKLFILQGVEICYFDKDGNPIGCINYKNTWIFEVLGLLDYYWEYLANGMKHVQIRFYKVDEVPTPAPAKGSPTTTWADIKSSS